MLHPVSLLGWQIESALHQSILVLCQDTSASSQQEDVLHKIFTCLVGCLLTCHNQTTKIKNTIHIILNINFNYCHHRNIILSKNIINVSVTRVKKLPSTHEFFQLLLLFFIQIPSDSCRLTQCEEYNFFFCNLIESPECFYEMFVSGGYRFVIYIDRLCLLAVYI